MSDENLQLKTELELVKKDIHQMNVIIGKLDTAIERISEVATSLNRVLAVQESKLSIHEKQLGHNVEVIHDRIEKHKSEVSTEIEKSHNVIMEEIRKLREDQHTHHQMMTERLGHLEKWRWVAIGGAAVAGFVLSHLPWENILS